MNFYAAENSLEWMILLALLSSARSINMQYNIEDQTVWVRKIHTFTRESIGIIIEHEVNIK